MVIVSRGGGISVSPDQETDVDLPDSDGVPVLTIDLGAVVQNYRYLKNKASGARTAGVVKANGYGCGGVEVAKARCRRGL